MNSMKDMWLVTFRGQWKKALQLKFKDSPEKLATINMHEMAQEWFENPMIKQACDMVGVTAEDIEKVLSSCRDELVKEGKKK
jgi:hypothetical protein